MERSGASDDHQPANMTTTGAATPVDATGTRFPFRDFLVARTNDPRADAAATLVARSLAACIGDVPVIRAEAETVERQARHAALAVVGTPAGRRPAGMPGGDPSSLARRLRIPLVVVPAHVDHDTSGVRSIVCGVRDHADAPTVIAAAALADALDLQLVLLHVCAQVRLSVAVQPMPPGAFATTTPDDRAAASHPRCPVPPCATSLGTATTRCSSAREHPSPR